MRMTRRHAMRIAVTAMAGLSGGAHAQNKAVTPALPAVEVYAALPAATGAQLSPNGRYLAFIAGVKGRNALVIWDLDGQAKPKVLDTGEGEPRRIIWKTDQRLIASIRVVTTRAQQMKTVDSRLIGLDVDGSHVEELIRGDKGDFNPQIQDNILSLLPQDPDHILVELPKIDRFSRAQASGYTANDRMKHPEAVLVNIHDGSTKTLAPQNGQINHWIADAKGEVRLGWAYQRDKSVNLLVRDTPEAPWRSVQNVALNVGQAFQPLAFVEDKPDRLYVEANHDTGYLGIHEFDLTRGQFIRTVAADPKGDLVAIVKEGHLIGYHDVSDRGPRYIDQKLADPDRIALVGGSYGGYAALMGLVKEPGLYRGAVAFAPVTDLRTLIDDQNQFIFGDINLPQIGTDSKQLDETSPAQQAHRITKPVLLVHGRKDYTVSAHQTELMAAALKKADKQAQTIYLEEGDHFLSRGEDRLTFLRALETFLASTLKR